MSWFYLLLAAVFEVTWAVAMKYSNGFTVLWPSLITAVTYVLSAVFLSFSLKNLNLGMAYAMWTGFGIVGTAVLGVLLFHETMSVTQVICVLLIVTGIVGLKLTSA